MGGDEQDGAGLWARFDELTEIERFLAPLRVEPGRKVSLATDFDPAWRPGEVDKDGGDGLLEKTVELLGRHQDRLWADGRSSVLLVLQARDAAGKDSAIEHVMTGVNPQGVDVRSFRAPSAEEYAHDFLWRCQNALPERGRIGIFNRSHYEEVLVVRVHPEYLGSARLPSLPADLGELWEERYASINAWERHLAANGTRVVKVLLNVSKEEQRKRFLARIDEPQKNWKFSAADLKERARWDAYDEAFGAMLSATSTDWAPWYVVPADRKWLAHVCVALVLAQALMEIDPRYPEVSAEQAAALADSRRALEAEA